VHHQKTLLHAVGGVKRKNAILNVTTERHNVACKANRKAVLTDIEPLLGQTHSTAAQVALAHIIYRGTGPVDLKNKNR